MCHSRSHEARVLIPTASIPLDSLSSTDLPSPRFGPGKAPVVPVGPGGPLYSVIFGVTIMRFNKFVAIVFLLLAGLITLFPPYSYGEERMGSEAERTQFIDPYLTQLRVKDVLPIKDRSSLFGDIKRDMVVAFGNKDKKPIHMTLERKLLWSDLVLQYILALVLAGFLYVLVPGGKRQDERVEP